MTRKYARLCRSCAYINKMPSMTFGIGKRNTLPCDCCDEWTECVTARIEPEVARQRYLEYKEKARNV